ncbi:hypothetical protein ABIF90_005805 [Bradyrhizobium japonicum]
MEPEVAIRKFARAAGRENNLAEFAAAVECPGRPGRGIKATKAA